MPNLIPGQVTRPDKNPTLIEPFLQDVVVDGTPESPIMGRPTLPIPLHMFDGCVQMIVG